jgi:hypothetical protein
METAAESFPISGFKAWLLKLTEAWKSITAVIVGLVLVGAIAIFIARRPPTLSSPKQISTEYQAVLLDNGSAYFGKVIETNRDYVVLQEVYYVQSRTNPDTKQVSNVLVKRGKEWHAPDRMLINRQHLVFIEPVSPDSMVAKLIAQSKQ